MTLKWSVFFAQKKEYENQKREFCERTLKEIES